MSDTSYFLHSPASTASGPASRYAILPLPYERTVSFGKGTGAGPDAIITASHEVEDFDEELRIPVDLDMQMLSSPFLEGQPDKKALELIRENAEQSMKKKQFVLSLGGEHTVTVPLVEAATTAFGQLAVLQLDAHTDLRDEFRGSSNSHACVMRRILDGGSKTIHAGIRSCSVTEFKFAEKNKLPVFWAKDIVADPARTWINKIVKLLPEKVYLTIDIDVLDPSLVPGTGTPEPGGLSWFDIIALIREVIRSRQVVAADIVEVAPFKGSHVSEFTAARLAARLLMYHKHRNTL
jgi:agmatinase